MDEGSGRGPDYVYSRSVQKDMGCTVGISGKVWAFKSKTLSSHGVMKEKINHHAGTIEYHDMLNYFVLVKH